MDGDFTYGLPTNFEVDMAKSIIKQQATVRKRFVARFMKLVELQIQTGRESNLEIRQRDKGLTIQLIDAKCNCFTIYDFESADQMNSGFKLIEKHFKTGDVIPYYSMSCADRQK